MMHTMYYANEVSESPTRQTRTSEEEIRLGVDLIESMNDEFRPDKYRDEYRIPVLAMLDEKSKGREIRASPTRLR